MASLTVGAVQVGSGMAVTDFRFIINADNVRDPNDPDPARWPSLSPAASHSPLVATGDAAHATVDVPPGRYLVTIRAPEHKLGGEWVTVSGDTASPSPCSHTHCHCASCGSGSSTTTTR